MNKCQRCGHGWESRTKRVPASCPACKSYKWAEAPATGAKKELEYGNTDVTELGRDLAELTSRKRTARDEFEGLESRDWRLAFPVDEIGAGEVPDASGESVGKAVEVDDERESGE